MSFRIYQQPATVVCIWVDLGVPCYSTLVTAVFLCLWCPRSCVIPVDALCLISCFTLLWISNHAIIKEDLAQLEAWAKHWGMEFNTQVLNLK